MMQKESSLVFLHYLTTVFDNIGDAILLIGIEPHEQYRLLMANEAFFRNTGHPKTAVGRLVHEVVTPASYANLKMQYKKAILTKQPLEYTEWYKVPLGRAAYEVKIIPLTNAVGECVQLAAITRNVTELERLREENKTLKKQLKNGA